MQQLEEIKQKINATLEEFFEKKLAEAKAKDPYAETLINALKDFTMRGGKRLRAALIYYGYKAFKAGDEDEILKASISIELIQSFMLIHDDIIDRDELRRGGPTVHKVFERYHREHFRKKDPKRFGSSMAIILGDLAGAFANELFADIQLPAENKLNAIVELNRTLSTVMYGEALDVLSELREGLMEEDLLKVNRYKTSSYTFDGPLRIGALLAGANKTQIDSLNSYAINLGMAFQLQDDILGLYGDEKKFGKPIGSDWREGKMTLLSLKALELLPNAGSLKQKLGKTDLSHKEIEEIRKLVKDCGSLEYSRKLMKALVEKARSSLKKAEISPEAREFLEDIAGYMLERNI